MNEYWMNIHGAILVDVDHDKFLDELYKWCESKGWKFSGYTEPTKDKTEKFEEEDIPEKYEHLNAVGTFSEELYKAINPEEK